MLLFGLWWFFLQPTIILCTTLSHCTVEAKRGFYQSCLLRKEKKNQHWKDDRYCFKFLCFVFLFPLWNLGGQWGDKSFVLNGLSEDNLLYQKKKKVLQKSIRKAKTFSIALLVPVAKDDQALNPIFRVVM